MKKLIYSKVEIYGGGGGGSGVAPGARGITFLDVLTKSDLVLAFNHENVLQIVKNRHGDNGILNTEMAIHIFSEIIAKMIFQERMLVFQESIKERLIKNISKTIEMGGGEFLDTIQRACSSNGS